MNIETIRNYCLEKPSVEEGMPFGETVVVFKVVGKMFLLLPVDTEGVQFNVKCDPEKAVELRANYSCVQPGFHMNKIHWNTIYVDGTVTDQLIFEWIDDSYNLIKAGIKIKVKKKVKKKIAKKVKK